MTTKTLIVEPASLTSAGLALHAILNEIHEVAYSDFYQCFEFVSVSHQTARPAWTHWEGRRALVVGLATLVALWRQTPASGLLWGLDGGVTWCHVPQPQWQVLDPFVRLAVGLRLEEELHRGMV